MIRVALYASVAAAKRCRTLPLALIVLVAVSGCGSSAPSPIGNPDPGHRLMRRVVAPVLTAVPVTARATRRQRIEPIWDSCDGVPSTFGWDAVMAVAEFREDESPGTIVHEVQDALRHLGWTFRSRASGLGVWRWYRPLPVGKEARVELDGGPHTQEHFWELTASAPPLARAVHGC